VSVATGMGIATGIGMGVGNGGSQGLGDMKDTLRCPSLFSGPKWNCGWMRVGPDSAFPIAREKCLSHNIPHAFVPHVGETVPSQGRQGPRNPET